MSAYRFTPTAKERLAAIFRYSAAKFGERRAARYMGAIDEVVKPAAAGESVLRPCEHYGPGLHSVRSGSHVIFIRREADFLVVVGVLHQMMEPSRHLSADDG